jgi:hypothetical protein
MFYISGYDAVKQSMHLISPRERKKEENKK